MYATYIFVDNNIDQTQLLQNRERITDSITYNLYLPFECVLKDALKLLLVPFNPFVENSTIATFSEEFIGLDGGELEHR